MKCSGKSHQQIHEADTSNRRRQIEAPRIDLRSRNPMVVALHVNLDKMLELRRETFTA
jgi:hypothetical protein